MKLSKVKFQDVSKNQELSKDDQKLILGGYSGSSCCYWESSYGSDCTSSSFTAYFMGTSYWACNTDGVKERCNC